MKKKIGLVTYYKENYGSVLQCYSTKYVLESLGFECHVIYRKYSNSRFSAERIHNIVQHAFRAIKYKGYFKQYIAMHKAMNEEKGYLTSDAKKKLNNFIDEKICPEGYTWKELCQLGKNSEYAAFIAGSDQIWNASINIDPIFFLEFTTKEKRIAFAPSFGVARIPSFNLKEVQKGINGFDRIAIREETGEKILKKLGHAPIVRIADPVVMLKKEEWESFYGNNDIIKEKFIFVHFLNRPSEKAIEIINRLSVEHNLSVLLFSYDYEEYTKIQRGRKYNGNPVEYVGLINTAEYICTDSFHTTMISIILNRRFYTFHRQYLHSSNQSSRIVDLVGRYHLDRFYISEDRSEIPSWWTVNWLDVNNNLEKERNKTLNYLKSEITERIK